MKSPYIVTSGAGFDAGVVPAGPLRPAGVTEKRSPPDGYLEALSSLVSEPSISAEEKAEADRLIAERWSLNDRTNRLLDAFRARVRIEVAKEHEAAKAEVRAQQEKLRQHHEGIAALVRELNQANEKKGLAFAARDAAQQQKRELSRYATTSQIERANLLLLKREAEAEYASQETGALQGRINHMTLTELKPLVERLNELVAEEARLAHFVTGQSYTTDLGLVVPQCPPL